MRQIWPYGRAGEPRRNWWSPNMPDFSRGYARIPGQEKGWAPRFEIRCSGSESGPEALSPQCPDFFHTVGTLRCLGLLCLWRWKPLGASLVAEMVKKPLGKYLTLLSLEHRVQTRKTCRRVGSSAQRRLLGSSATICQLLLLHQAVLLAGTDGAAKETGGADGRTRF